MTWLLHILGLDNASGTSYLAWSGVGGDVAIIAGIVAAIRRAARHHRERLAQAVQHHQEKLAQAAEHHKTHLELLRRHHQQALDQAAPSGPAAERLVPPPVTPKAAPRKARTSG